MKGEQFPAHGGVGIAKWDATKQRCSSRIGFGCDDHHAIEAVQYLHKAVAILVDAGGAGFVG